MKIEKFLKELRDSADIQYIIFTQGSCFRLYSILKTIFPEAKAYWSDRDNHTIIKIGKKFYDIGGEVHKDYMDNLGYYLIPKNQLKGYKLLKWIDKETSIPSKVEKYKHESNK